MFDHLRQRSRNNQSIFFLLNHFYQNKRKNLRFTFALTFTLFPPLVFSLVLSFLLWHTTLAPFLSFFLYRSRIHHAHSMILGNERLSPTFPQNERRIPQEYSAKYLVFVSRTETAIRQSLATRVRQPVHLLNLNSLYNVER